MSHDAAHSPSPAGLPAVPARLPLTPAIIFGIAGLFTFVASQIWIAAAAAVWAIGGYFHFGLTGFEVLAVAFGLPALYACWKVLRLAIEAERDPANQ